MTARPIQLVAMGDAEDVATWSGIPAHFLQAARIEGLPIDGLRCDLAAARAPLRNARWALGRLARLAAPRGLQYSDGFLRALWRTTPLPPAGAVLVNVTQVFPSHVARDPTYRLAFFIDQTLRQLFDYYEQGRHVARDIQRTAIAREQAQYRQAVAIIAQSRWAARNVIDAYGIAADKVHVVIPGANIDTATLAAWDAAHPVPRLDRPGPLRLGFVGKDWQRKGLHRLIGAVTLVRSQGTAVELHVVGTDRASVPAHLADAKGVQWEGFIDKAATPRRMTDFLDRIDVGCLLSSKEAGGFSLLEFARLGIPTIAPDTGGAPEYTVAGATSLIAPEADDATVAAAITALAADDARFAAQRQAAWDGRLWADWRRCAREVGAVLSRVP